MDNTMMKANKVVEMINARGIKAEVMVKNITGIEEIGICIGEGKGRPNVCPDFNTNNLEGLADDLIKVYEEHKDEGEKMGDIASRYGDFDYVKDNIIPCLVPNVAEDLVSKDYLDLKVMLRFSFPDVSASIAIKKDHLAMWGDVTEDDLFDIAMKNMKDKFIDESMVDILGLPPFMDDFMRVISTKNKLYGASALLYPELFEKYENARIIPSSIHELIVVTESGTTDAALVDMITEVNQSQVSPKERLSNHPYVFENGVIKGVA